LWDGENPARAEYFTRLNLNLNDTEMLLEVHQPKGALNELFVADRPGG
jgi:transcription initiation factor TFIID subunit 1